jgi:predicted RecA/RadA family phage recombinase
MNAVYVQRGEYVDVVPEADVKAGDIYVKGGLVGVSKLDIRAGELGAVATTGIYDVTKGGEAFAAGERVRWNPDAREAGHEGAVALGTAVCDADAESRTVRVILRGGAGSCSGGAPGGTPSSAIQDVALASVTEGGAWSGGDGNANMVTDFRNIRDTLNAVLAALRAHGVIGED